MAMFTENPLAVIVMGGVAATAALVFFLARRTGGSLVALASILAVTGLLIVAERVIVTEREEVEQSVAEMFEAIEANDVQRVLASVDPNSNLPKDVQALMPLIHVEKCRTLSRLDVDLHMDQPPPSAVSTSRVALTGTHASSGTPVGYVNQRVDITWIKPAGRWVVTGYAAYYEGKPINAVESARANQAR